MDGRLPGFVVHEIFFRQEYWSGLHSLLPGIILTQGSNPSLLHCREILYHLSHQGSPFPSIPSSSPEAGLGFHVRIGCEDQDSTWGSGCYLLVRSWYCLRAGQGLFPRVRGLEKPQTHVRQRRHPSHHSFPLAVRCWLTWHTYLQKSVCVCVCMCNLLMTTALRSEKSVQAWANQQSVP